jgi:hypothetical protein
MKKAGISTIICFSLLLITSIATISYQPRSERKAKYLMRTVLLINLSAYAFGIRGGWLVCKNSETKN